MAWGDVGILLGATDTLLYEVNEYSGEQTFIGSFGLPEGSKMGGIALDFLRQRLYGVEFVNNGLYEIDLDTGETEFIGSLGIEINGTAVLDYYWEDDCLYLSTFTQQGELYKVDKDIGECTLIGEYQGSADISALTIDPDRFYLPTANFTWSPRYPQPGETIEFNASSSYVEGGNVILYKWDWNFDLIFDESSTNPITVHMWNETGYYPVTLLVQDNNNYMDTQRYVVYVGNLPPVTPTIEGPLSGKPEVDYNYTFVSTDPDGDDVWYHIGWGDNEIIYIYGPYPSGQELTLSYNWSEKGTFTINAMAKDIFDAESNWSEFEVEIPRTRASSYLWIEWLFERFPLLEKLLNLLR